MDEWTENVASVIMGVWGIWEGKKQNYRNAFHSLESSDEKSQ